MTIDVGNVPAAAREAFDRAAELLRERRFVDAVAPAEEAARLAPNWESPWWDLTVAYKHAHRWRDVLAAADRYAQLARDPGDGPHWNAGIAATALGDWPRARAAWRACKIPIPDGEGPIVMNIGPTPIRIRPEEAAEVVWCERIDPARAIVRSVPLPDSERRYGDLVLHDGEPRGKRKLGDREVSVFDELALLQASRYATWRVVIHAADAAAMTAFVAGFDDTDTCVEDWTESIVPLCKDCSLGRPHDHHERERDLGWRPERRLGVAAKSEGDLAPLRTSTGRWRDGVVSVDLVLSAG